MGDAGSDSVTTVRRTTGRATACAVGAMGGRADCAGDARRGDSPKRMARWFRRYGARHRSVRGLGEEPRGGRARPRLHPRQTSRASDRRAHARLTPVAPHCPISARFKYGGAVTLVDVSSGGALLETSRQLRPDMDLVLEILDARTHDITHVVSRILRSYVAGLEDGVTYRGACAFKRPLVHPALVP